MSYESRSRCKERQITPCGICPLMFKCPYDEEDEDKYNNHTIYIEKGIGDEFGVYPFTDNNVCKPIAYIKYVHQL